MFLYTLGGNHIHFCAVLLGNMVLALSKLSLSDDISDSLLLMDSGMFFSMVGE